MDKTLEEVAEYYGFNRERIRLIETKAIRKLIRRLSDRGYVREDFFAHEINQVSERHSSRKQPKILEDYASH